MTDINRLDELKANGSFPEIANGTYWYPVQFVGNRETNAERLLQDYYMIGWITITNSAITKRSLTNWYAGYPPTQDYDLSNYLYMYSHSAVKFYNKDQVKDVLPVFTLDINGTKLDVTKHTE